MTKDTVLGIINILLCLFFVHFISTTGTFVSLINGVLFIFFCINAFLAYKLLIHKTHKQSFKLSVLLTFSTLYWFLLFFVGYSFAANKIFPLISFAIIVAMYYYLNKTSKKIAIMLSLITLIISVVTFTSGFEEDYCSKKGEEADNSGSKMVIATKRDALQLKDFEVKEGIQIGVNFRTHMLCHQTFNFLEIFKEQYLFQK